MSWIERIKNNISITTGDGKVFTPEYSYGERSIDYNVAEFEFPNIGGTLVKRSKHKGTRFTLDLTFQGDDCIDVARDFELSARDERPWKISHPLYDNIIVQPTSMKIDNRNLNTSKIQVDVVETIVEDAPKVLQDPKDKTTQDILIQQQTAAESFVNDVSPTPSDLNMISDTTDESYNQCVDAIRDEKEYNRFVNMYNAAQAAILDGVDSTLDMVTAVQDLLTFPSTFQTALLIRLSLLKSQLETLSATIENLITPNEKKIYETNAGSLIMAMVNASINPYDGSDYENKKDVLNVIDVLLTNYNLYLNDLDELQTENGGDIDSFMPDFEAMNQLSTVFSYAISQLFTISLGAQQERVVYLENDSNIISLTHRFYGLDADDVMLDKFMKNNNIGINELLQIKKGREITYYVSA